MPYCNRVDPSGALHAVSVRGTLMGNRGRLHDYRGEPTRRRWTTRAWIACRLSFRDRHQVINAPRHYTQLFFLDDATALAAGHRPCGECRRSDLRAFMNALLAAGWPQDRRRASFVDRILHAERELSGDMVREPTPIANLPDGAIVRLPYAAADRFHLVWRGCLRSWSHSGYGPAMPAAPDTPVVPVTPPLVLAALAHGHVPGLHPSAMEK